MLFCRASSRRFSERPGRRSFCFAQHAQAVVSSSNSRDLAERVKAMVAFCCVVEQLGCSEPHSEDPRMMNGGGKRHDQKRTGTQPDRGNQENLKHAETQTSGKDRPAPQGASEKSGKN